MEIEVQVEESAMNLEVEDKEEEWEVLVSTLRPCASPAKALQRLVWAR